MDYELGLEQLARRARGTDWFEEYALYEARLRDNLHDTNIYGSTEQLRSDRARIVNQLNHLALTRLNVSFTDLCTSKKSGSPTLTAHSSPISEQRNNPHDSRPSTIPPGHLPQNDQYSSPGKVFISYSNKDRQYLEELRTHLAADIRSGRVTCWDDTEIRPGAVWRKEVEKSLREAELAILLVSVDFLASDSLMKDQFPQLLTAEKNGRLTILGVIVRPCLFNSTELAHISTINDPSQPLSGMKRTKRDEVWIKVVEYIQVYFKKVS
jgi:hypothetical protein